MISLLPPHERTLPWDCEVLMDAYSFDDFHKDTQLLESLCEIKRLTMTYSPINCVRGFAICRKTDKLLEYFKKNE